MEPVKRRVVFVVGAGRDGTRTTTAALRALGMRVPQDTSENRNEGTLEPPWVVDLHRELFDRTGVHDGDGRPSAWYDAGKLAQFELLRQRVTTWLEAQFAEAQRLEVGPELVISDERLAWFAGLWRAAALRCGAAPSYVVVLGPSSGAGDEAGDEAGTEASGGAGRAAAWVNLALHTERATRGSSRTFVRPDDLLEDWTRPVFAIGRAFDLAAITEATANAQRAVHSILEAPGLAAATATGAATSDDRPTPPRLRELIEQSRQTLDLLAEPEGDRPDVHDRLDALRADYADLYAEAEALSASTARASYRCGRLVDIDPVHPHAAAVVAPGRPPTPAPGAGVGPDGAGGSVRVPHRVRALVPPRARRGLRRALGRERGA